MPTAATDTMVPRLMLEGGTMSTAVMDARGMATGGPLVRA